MKFLTPIYLTLMHAFADRAEQQLERLSKMNISRPYFNMEYRTLRLDAGRQSGKSSALLQFEADWLCSGGHVIHISWNSDSAKLAKEQCKELLKRNYMFDPQQEIKKYHTVASIRQFLSDGWTDKFRGTTMEKVLVVVDEPLDRMPAISKLYEKYETSLRFCSRTPPLFFIIGCQ